ncbi:Ig-like domain-containing protein [Massilia violaceinigra]|uniref:Ig-like domain-containing protein n=1 Tax=Massilia violaceinigra TaxID=2045208 RepID=A0ABY4A739_9BURK|nr:pectinesterase family protein [Massilia violaceinigra]UOD28463.1 Ig-like domain-containing protein [Massilia violaceinigra]
MKEAPIRVALSAALLMAFACQQAHAATDPARQGAPLDGWASQSGGTVGGANAVPEQIYTVADRAQLLAALRNGGNSSKIIKLTGIIDMSGGVPYASTGDQAARGAIRLGSNTTLIGAGASAGIVNGHIAVQNVEQVIIRNLKIMNPCDAGPIWDPLDGASGNWNSAYDGIGMSNSHHVWIDHNSFTDAPKTDDQLPIENGKQKQCHDGALDITSASDFVTVSYNHFGQHNKNNLIGGGDGATGDEGKLRVTYSNNVFADISQRAPRVRFGMVHLFNNYHSGSKTAPVYHHQYSVGVGKNAKILSHNNVFAIAGATRCDDVINAPGGDGGAWKDQGSQLNGGALQGCSVPATVSWTVPYAFTPRPVALVKANALAQAGGGKLSTSITGSGDTSTGTLPTLFCPPTGLYFCDDFQDGSGARWSLLPLAGPNGAFAVQPDAPGASNKVLQYTAASNGGILALVKPEAFKGVPSGDYFVEARIRPLTNSTTGNKQLYLIARYADPANWYGAGLNVQNASTSTQVEIARMLGNSLSKIKQSKRAIAMDAQFYTVRFEMIGSTLTVYLDGENLGAVTDSSFAARGLIGLYTTNKSFQIDDVRVGDPALKPVQLTLNPHPLAYTAEAGDAPLVINVGAKKGDGSADSFTVESSKPGVVGVSIDGASVTLTPLAAGSAKIVFTSGADPTLTRSIGATIAPAFVQPAQTYRLDGASFPPAGAVDEAIDSPLTLTFDNPPTLGSGGTIRIFRKSDDALVDVIRPAEDVDAIGHAGQDRLRRVRYAPVRIKGNTVSIKPHNNRLAYGSAYYVAIADGVFTGATLGGTPFRGIGKAGGWGFTTKAGAPSSASLVVDDDGPADFRTVQGALNHATTAFAKADPVTISVRNGSYEELLYLRGKDNLTIQGESRDGVLIHYTNYDTLNPGTGASEAPGSGGAPLGGRSVLLVEAADMLTLDKLTLKNTTLRAPAISAQAETLYFNSEGRLVATNAAFHSEQDTLNLKGYAWFYRSLVAGNVDFIWGGARAALFEESEIRSVGDSTSASAGGYVLQARVPNAGDKGFVFLGSRLTHGPGPGPAQGDVPNGATWLARSPGGTGSWDNIAFINCKMDAHVAPAGWAGPGVNGQPAPNPVQPSALSGWREFGTTDLQGAPLNLSARVGGYLLSEDEVAAGFATRAKVFAAWNNGLGWNP